MDSRTGRERRVALRATHDVHPLRRAERSSMQPRSHRLDVTQSVQPLSAADWCTSLSMCGMQVDIQRLAVEKELKEKS
jgi:hypothetical protein